MQSKQKKGISLITVLLFMLVATIAATGIYKWLSSANRASAARLKQSEVYQASQAGVETVRSWISYQGDDAGALIKYYLDNDKKPVCLDSVLRPLVSNKSQKFSVYLVGVDVTSYPYKLKFISTGTARNGSKYSQVAILKVDGLYRVSVPSKSSTINFNKSFYGEAPTFVGTDTVESAIINGNYSGNQPVVEDVMVVTGNVTYNGITTSGGDLYIGGDYSNQGTLTIGASGQDTNVVYIGGDMTNCAGGIFTVYGDLYVGGNVASNCKLLVTGDATMNGTVYRTNDAHDFVVGGNLIFTKNGTLNLNGGTNFKVTGNVISPKEVLNGAGVVMLWGDANDAQVWKNESATYSIPTSPTTTVAPYNFYPIGTTTAQFKTKGTYKGQTFDQAALVTSWGVSYSKMKSYGDLITSGDTVPTPILLSNYSAWSDSSANAYCGLNSSNANEMNPTLVNAINSCYDKASAAGVKLYNGFLVLTLNITSSNGNATVSLDGKFVFILTGNAQLHLPSTTNATNKSVVLLYLPSGWNNDIMPAEGANGDPYNYLIYSEGNISQFLSWKTKALTGSVIMTNGSSLERSQGGSSFQYNEDVINALADAGIIEGNPEYGSGGSSSSTSGGTTTGSAGAKDPYYVALMPRLIVTVESEYANTELDVDELDATNSVVLEGSILVMPRVIYLPTNAPGKLNEYYSVINLNGATEDGNGSVSCTPTGLSTTSTVSGADEAIYNCTYHPSNSAYNTCLFYVVVAGTVEENPKIGFTETFHSFPLAGDCYNVQVEIATGTQSVSVDVQQINTLPSNWTITPLAGTEVKSSNVWTISAAPGGVTSVFNVCANASATSGYVTLQLGGPQDGCTIDNARNPITISLTGSFTVVREDISTYLGLYTDNDSLAAFAARPDCDTSYISGTWVSASGVGCTESPKNESWKCVISESTTLVEGSGYNKDACELKIIDKTIVGSDGKIDTLYAGLKLRAYTLTIDMTDAMSNSSKVTVTHDDGGTTVEDGVCDGGDNICALSVYYGRHYTLTADADGVDTFSYFECDGKGCSQSSFNDSPMPLIPTGNDTVTVKFNEPSSCFEETFTDLNADCSAAEHVRCIDECASGQSCNVTTGGVYSSSAEWTMIYSNNTDASDLFIKPTIDRADGYVETASISGSGTGAGNEKQTFVLRSTKAGYDGTFTAQIRAYYKNNSMNNQWLNTGIVFRSNATGTSYYTLSVLPKKSETTNLLRVCFATTQSIGNSSHCIVGGNATSAWGATSDLDNVETYTVTAILSGDNLKVSVTDGNGVVYISETSFDLFNSTLNVTGVSESANEYVGFKINDGNFRAYNLAWSSTTYGCTGSPKLYCSFSANYPAAVVPANTSVAPWAYVSRFCGTQTAGCCTYSFYTVKDKTYSWWKYIWTTSYLEGPWTTTSFNEGVYPDSTVLAVATCNNGINSLTFAGATAADCGAFTVGKLGTCTENYTVGNATEYCSGTTPCVFANTTNMNMRSATLKFDLNFTGTLTGVYVQLVDSTGDTSQVAGPYTTAGTLSVSVSDLIDVEGFDPQKIREVLFTGKSGDYYTVSNVISSCANVLSISNCTATLSGTTLTFGASVNNGETCSISSGAGVSAVSGLTCTTGFSQNVTVSSADLITYAGQTESYTLTASKTGYSDTCTASVTFPSPSSSSSSEVASSSSVAEPAVTGCSVTSAGAFTANLSNTDNVSYDYSIAVTDNLGNVIKSTNNATSTATALSWTYLPTTGGYTYYYNIHVTVNGADVLKFGCSPTPTLTITANPTLTCSWSPTTVAGGGTVTLTATVANLASGATCNYDHALGSCSVAEGSNTYTSTPAISATHIYSVTSGDTTMTCSQYIDVTSSSSSVASSSSAKSSSSVVTITATDSSKTVSSGSCMNVDFTWSNQYWLPQLYLYCSSCGYSGCTETASYNSKTTTATDWNNLSLLLGTVPSSLHVQFSNICVSRPDGQTMTCWVNN